MIARKIDIAHLLKFKTIRSIRETLRRFKLEEIRKKTFKTYWIIKFLRLKKAVGNRR